MNPNDIVEREYFNWMYDYVCKNRVNKYVSYKKLFSMLFEIEFTYIIPNDENRAIDGIDLRHRFCNQIYEEEGVYPVLEESPCSVLEMILALAIRCEESIMDDPLYGNRTGQWFWTMLSNMGIGLMTDDIFDRDFVYEKLNIFLNRRYEPNGKGGLFYIRDCEEDLRDVEIWAQLCWFLNKFN